MDQNVRDLVDSRVAKLVEWDGHDTEQHDDTNAVGERKVPLLSLRKLQQEEIRWVRSESSGERQVLFSLHLKACDARAVVAVEAQAHIRTTLGVDA
jgi:hypothetical protein